MLWIAIIVGILVEEEGKPVFQMKSLQLLFQLYKFLHVSLLHVHMNR